MAVNNKGNTSKFTTPNSSLVGFYSAITTAALTVVTFALAIIAIPISGANCAEGCIDYPYLDTISQYPRDFLWMYLAIPMLLAYVAFMVSIHFYANEEKKIFSQIGLLFAAMSALILIVDYFIQVSVIPISLMHGETDGLAALIQYNVHGVFIALEDLGYLLMSLSFLFMAAVFSQKDRLESAIRWIFIIAFILAIVSLAAISINFGLDRKDRFEVIVLSVDWLVLIINGILLSRVFRKHMKTRR
ncbi:MAG: hypothetical protein JW908_03440 [Anaerolineales bacterium]|nr:hypothetical protein [Anaerolineales bacterium]